MACISIKIRPTLTPGGRILVWLVRPSLGTAIISHNVDDDGWEATVLLRSEAYRYGSFVDEIAVYAPKYLTGHEVHRLLQEGEWPL